MDKKKVFLKKNEERRIKKGHLWIFNNEIDKSEGEPQNGEIVSVYDSKNVFMGEGFFNKNSLIAVRIFSESGGADIKEILKERIIKADNYRRSVYSFRNSYRMVFSESDYIPGLIIDKYNDSYVLQVYSAAIEKNIKAVIEVLKDKYKAVNIFTRNESRFRELENLSLEDSVYAGETGSEIINDGYLNYKINFTSSQKTGFFLDQCDNREFLRKISSGKRVLDLFCNAGGFGMHASLGGAARVEFVDSSSEALDAARENYALNNLKTDAEFIRSDAFDYLKETAAEKKEFDIVMVDPPAFAKTKKSVQAAKTGYEKLNKLAMRIVKNGGLLATSSCSHHIKKELFKEIIQSAALKAGRKIQLVYFNGASLDHPSLPSMEETEYLKFAAFRVL